MDNPLHNSKIRLLDATLKVFRTKGYTASTVDDICAAAGVTKGSFFHHFKGKLELALSAVDYWNTTTGGLFANAPYRQIADPRDRVLAYIDFRSAIVQGEAPEFSCLLGTLVQETFASQPALREACNQGITMHAQTVAIDLAAAKDAYARGAPWDPEALALYTQAVIQGAFVLTKAQGNPAIARTCIAQLRDHVAGLLGAARDVCHHPHPHPHQETTP